MPRTIALLLLALSGTTAAAPMPSALAALVEQRAAIAFNLSHPIADCVARRDTTHPAFHGCIDWHSAVHGTWALVAYARATGDHRYDALIDATLEPTALAAEQRDLAARPNFEMPYGRAWFLRLALEHHRRDGSERLRPMADAVARSMVEYYRTTPPLLESAAYDSASWALINLHDYGVERGDPALVAFVEQQVRARFMTGVERCRAPEALPEFMAVCSNVLWLAAKALPPKEFVRWSAPLLPLVLELQPIDQPRRAHEFGKGFSRAWGLLGLYRATGDVRFAQTYARHFVASYRDPQHWAGDYGSVGHWVAQFGMFALQPLFELEPRLGSTP